MIKAAWGATQSETETSTARNKGSKEGGLYNGLMATERHGQSFTVDGYFVITIDHRLSIDSVLSPATTGRSRTMRIPVQNTLGV